jgi:hypothetical protein
LEEQKMKKRNVSATLSVSAALLVAQSLFPTRALAQGTDTALVRGAVTDASGASVPKATVTMTNDGTDVVDKATTDELGRYIFEVLKPASYTAKLEAKGFKTVVRKNIVLRVGDQTDIDFTGQCHPDGRGDVYASVVEHGECGAGNTGNEAIPHQPASGGPQHRQLDLSDSWDYGGLRF